MHRAPHGKRVWGGSAPKEADSEKLFHQAAGARSQKEAQRTAKEKRQKRRTSDKEKILRMPRRRK